jgi:regulator of protease activity HflC (stomatin/prohibitin superfamily)
MLNTTSNAIGTSLASSAVMMAANLSTSSLMQKRTYHFGNTIIRKNNVFDEITPIRQRNICTVVDEYEKGVTFTLGKLTSIKDPGLRIRIPIFQWMWKADMRICLADLDKQQMSTYDNITVTVDGVVQYRIVDPKTAICNIEGVGRLVKVGDWFKRKGVEDAIKEQAQLKIREEICKRDLNEILHKRKELAQQLLEETQELTKDWGVEIHSIRIKNIIFDETMIRALAKRAEAERTAEAKMINADADVKTAKIYEEAAEIYKRNQTAMRLRELEAFGRMAAEPSNTLVLIPTEILDSLKRLKD